MEDQSNHWIAINQQFKQAYAVTKGNLLIVSTGVVERCWKWTGNGLITVGLKDENGTDWAEKGSQEVSDWKAPNLMNKNDYARILGIQAGISDDQGFTSQHLEVVVEMEYVLSKVKIKYVIWAYPGARGLRTQLWIKGEGYSEKNRDINRPIMEPVKDNQLHCIRLHRLDATKAYTLNFSTKAHASTVKPELQFRTIDGETTINGLADLLVQEDEKHHHNHIAKMYTITIPESIRPDGSCEVLITVPNHANFISEIWLNEEKGSSGLQNIVAYMNVDSALTNEPNPREDNRVDYIPIKVKEQSKFRAIGYYNDTQHRNTPETPAIREEVIQTPSVDWASIFCIEDDRGGLAMVKESHKCVNQSGVNTGEFCISEDGLHNTGWGLSFSELDPQQYKWCWASWIVLYDGSELGRQNAIKQFDRLRFPVNAERDMWVLTCTWGHSLHARDGRNYATEKEVLKEMEAASNMGIDMVLIDDGWQVSLEAENWKPDGNQGWKPHPQVYPEGWKHVVAKKKALNLRLGLWGVAQHIPLEDMVWNWKQIQMNQLKLDFASLNNHTALSDLINKVRTFMLQTNRRCIISWDTTENAARYGYYWAREYGNVHFMNRKHKNPDNVVYIPWLALRDFWHLAHYQNLNKWQLTIHNPEVVDREKSDAYLYSPAYCVATALMGTPQFMALPSYYSDASRKEIKRLLDVYKKHRDEIFHSDVYPVGEEPTNHSWSGFQAWDVSKNQGYVTIFRERLNKETNKEIPLNYMEKGMHIKITDLLNEETQEIVAGDGGAVKFVLNNPGQYLFAKLEVYERT